MFRSLHYLVPILGHGVLASLSDTHFVFDGLNPGAPATLGPQLSSAAKPRPDTPSCSSLRPGEQPPGPIQPQGARELPLARLDPGHQEAPNDHWNYLSGLEDLVGATPEPPALHSYIHPQSSIFWNPLDWFEYLPTAQSQSEAPLQESRWPADAGTHRAHQAAAESLPPESQESAAPRAGKPTASTSDGPPEDRSPSEEAPNGLASPMDQASSALRPRVQRAFMAKARGPSGPVSKRARMAMDSGEVQKGPQHRPLQKKVSRPCHVATSRAHLGPRTAGTDTLAENQRGPKHVPASLAAPQQLVERLYGELTHRPKRLVYNMAGMLHLQKVIAAQQDAKEAKMAGHVAEAMLHKLESNQAQSGIGMFYVLEPDFSAFLADVYNVRYNLIAHGLRTQPRAAYRKNYEAHAREAVRAVESLSKSEAHWSADAKGRHELAQQLWVQWKKLYPLAEVPKAYAERVVKVLRVREMFVAYTALINTIIPRTEPTLTELASLQAGALHFFDSLWSLMECDQAGKMTGFGADWLPEGTQWLVEAMQRRINGRLRLEGVMPAAWQMIDAWLQTVRPDLYRQVAGDEHMKRFINHLFRYAIVN